MAVKEAWSSNEGPQRAFVENPLRDLCYGGSRGGGKTVALLLHIAKREHRWGDAINGVIFRKSYPELGEVIRKGKKFLCDQLGWRYVGNPHYTFTAPSGATLLCRYAENLEDAKKYDGFEWTDLGFDEIGNWATPEVCDYLLGCNRSGEGVPAVRRSTCMPGGPGHVWVKDRYDPEHPKRMLRLVPMPEEHPELVLESMFIPALMEDNPHIDRAEYEATLAATAAGGALFDAWRWGKWDTIAGAFFECWDERRMVDEQPVVRDWDVKWASCDWGYKDDCVVLWHAQDENRRVVTYREMKVNKTSPADLGRAIVAANEGDRLTVFVLSHEAFAEKTSARTIADEIASELTAAGLPHPQRADTDRKGGWMLMNQLLVAGYWRIGRSCRELIRALPILQRDMKDPEDVAESPVDHAPDAARYGLKTFLRATRIPRDELVRRYVAARLEAGGSRVSDELETRLLDGRMARIDVEGNVVSIESEAQAAHRWTHTARLSRVAEGKLRRRIRPKALPYGRRYGSF